MGAENTPSKTPFKSEDLIGLKYAAPLQGLLEQLHKDHEHPNRILHYDQYLSLLLLYYFNPVVTSLRGIQFASQLERVQKQLGVARASLGSLSEASHVFDPDLAKALFESLARQACALDVPAPLKGLPEGLAITAVDGSLLDALPRMMWALWLGPYEHAVKLHLQFEVSRGVPVGATLTHGNGNERETLKGELRAGCLYLLDRGYVDYDLYSAIMQAGSSFVARLKGDADYEVTETRPLSAAARAAGVVSDQIVWLGGEKSGRRIPQRLRILKIHVKNQAGQGLKPRLARVSSKVKAVRESKEEYDLWLVTDLLDVPAETIALLFRFRWQVELFFRWFKCVLGCKHLLAESENGVRIELYAALIASLLIVLWTGRKPTKRTLEMLQYHFLRMASTEEVEAHIASLKKVK